MAIETTADPVVLCFLQHIRQWFRPGEREGLHRTVALIGEEATKGAIIKASMKGALTWSMVFNVIEDHMKAGTVNDLEDFTKLGGTDSVKPDYSAYDK